MKDLIFEDKKKVLKDILYEEGRTQTWFKSKLEEYGISRDRSQISQYCTGKYRPRDEYILRAMAEILERDLDEIENCFKK